MPSWRKIERATYEDLPFRILAAEHHPDRHGLADIIYAPLVARLMSSIPGTFKDLGVQST